MNEKNETKHGIPEKLIAVFAALIIAAACGLFAYTLLAPAPAETSPKPTATPSVTPIADENGTLRPVHCYFPAAEGSCALIVSSHGENVLIDAGYDRDAESIVSFLDELGVEKLEHVFLTTPRSWALGGMAAVLERFACDCFILSDTAAAAPEAAPLMALLSQKGIPVKKVRADFVSTFDAVADGELRLLSPYEADYGTVSESALALRLAYGESRILFLSEAGPLAERMMIKALPNRLLHANILYAVETGAAEKHLPKFFKTVKPNLTLVKALPGTEGGGLTEAAEKRGFSPLDAGVPVHIVLDGVTAEMVE